MFHLLLFWIKPFQQLVGAQYVLALVVAGKYLKGIFGHSVTNVCGIDNRDSDNGDGKCELINGFTLFMS